jgi:hypothetical protein
MTERDEIITQLVGPMGRAERCPPGTHNLAEWPPAAVDLAPPSPPRREPPVEREMWLRRAPHSRSEMWMRSSPSWLERLPKTRSHVGPRRETAAKMLNSVNLQNWIARILTALGWDHSTSAQAPADAAASPPI